MARDRNSYIRRERVLARADAYTHALDLLKRKPVADAIEVMRRLLLENIERAKLEAGESKGEAHGQGEDDE